ncbi:MAG: GH3 auxin-responsive promoter family protein, partial [Bacteroidota bacterium]
TLGECSVMGLSEEGVYGHRWYLSVNEPDLESAHSRKTELVQHLDQILQKINDDYAVERQHALQRMELEIIPTRLALEWMTSMGKVGGQHKFPRVLKGAYAKSWFEFLAAQQAS